MSDDGRDASDADRTALPAGVEYRKFDGESRLATRGTPVYGEPSDGEWRLWDARRSKVAASYEKGLDLGLAGGEKILYLGAASGTTASHVADFSRVVYAVEFAARPMRDLVSVADDRENLVPLLKDARKPETYAHVVEPVEVMIQDVATRGQARVARANRRFLADDGWLVLAVKARSEDVTRDPDAVFDEVLADLEGDDGDEGGYEIIDRARLEPFHTDHLVVVARPR